jgi:hypothetical protein
MTQPLRSIRFWRTSSLLRVAPSLCPASVLSSLWVHHLDFSLFIGAAGSHVPHESPDHAHAASMPDATRAVSRLLSGFSRINDFPPVLTPFLRFRHVISGSLAFVFVVLT